MVYGIKYTLIGYMVYPKPLYPMVLDLSPVASDSNETSMRTSQVPGVSWHVADPDIGYINGSVLASIRLCNVQFCVQVALSAWRSTTFCVEHMVARGKEHSFLRSFW